MKFETSVGLSKRYGGTVFRYRRLIPGARWRVMGRLFLTAPRVVACSCGAAESLIFARVGITPGYFGACRKCGAVGTIAVDAQVAAVNVEREG